jgi:hypothetical protein
METGQRDFSINLRLYIMNEIICTTAIQGEFFKIDKGLNLHTPKGDIILKDRMEQISNEHKAMNRLYKPMALLFWIDVKNGKSANWRLQSSTIKYHTN